MFWKPVTGGAVDRDRVALAADRGDDDAPALADHLDRVAEHVGVHHADRDHGVVGHLAVGELPHLLLGLLRVAGRERGAELAGHLPLVRVRVDRDHVLGAGVRRALDRVHPHSAGAEDHDGLPRARAGGIHRRAPSGGHAARHQRRDLEREGRHRSERTSSRGSPTTARTFRARTSRRRPRRSRGSGTYRRGTSPCRRSGRRCTCSDDRSRQ